MDIDLRNNNGENEAPITNDRYNQLEIQFARMSAKLALIDDLLRENEDNIENEQRYWTYSRILVYLFKSRPNLYDFGPAIINNEHLHGYTDYREPKAMMIFKSFANGNEQWWGFIIKEVSPNKIIAFGGSLSNELTFWNPIKEEVEQYLQMKIRRSDVKIQPILYLTNPEENNNSCLAVMDILNQVSTKRFPTEINSTYIVINQDNNVTQELEDDRRDMIRMVQNFMPRGHIASI